MTILPTDLDYLIVHFTVHDAEDLQQAVCDKLDSQTNYQLVYVDTLAFVENYLKVESLPIVSEKSLGPATNTR